MKSYKTVESERDMVSTHRGTWRNDNKQSMRYNLNQTILNLRSASDYIASMTRRPSEAESIMADADFILNEAKKYWSKVKRKVAEHKASPADNLS